MITLVKLIKSCGCLFVAMRVNDILFVQQSSEGKCSNETMIVESRQSLYNQKLPTNTPISEPLQRGQVILIKGKILSNCTRFAVNLKCGMEENSDIAFHYNPRLDREYVVRNSYIRGRWCSNEETSSLIQSEFKQNESFELAIFVADEQFMVAVNGKHFCNFVFRLPLLSISTVQVLGAVDVDSVEFKQWNSYPPERSLIVPLESELLGREIQNEDGVLPMPYSGNLPKGFQTKWKLEICGRVKLLPHSFSINLQEGSQLWPHPIVPLHLNPRFNWVAGNDLFVRNAWLDGRWGSEERTQCFPFIPGSNFTLVIEKGNDYFSVWVDEVLISEFKFRGTVDGINNVNIKGDVVLYKIIMHDQSNS